MITELIPVINTIITFGLEPNLTVKRTDRDKVLEKSLVKIYSLYFDIQYDYDNTDFGEDKEYRYAEIRKNIESNFPDFGFYKTIPDLMDLDNKDNFGTGDAADDLTDIILDLLEIKRRIENNSLNDGLWYFEFIFSGHTRQHLIDLLNYLKQKD